MNIKPSKIHKTQTKLSSEFFAAAELYRRNFKVGVTLGNTEAIDLLAEKEGISFQIQVKGIQSKSSICWNISRDKVRPGIFFVLVNIHADTLQYPDFYILTFEEMQGMLKMVASGRDYLDITPVHNERFLGRWDKIE